MRRFSYFLFLLFIGILWMCPSADAAWTTKRLTWNSGRSIYPEIALGPSGHIHVVWYDNTHSNDEIYFKRSTDGGLSWSSAKRLSWSADRSYYPTVAVDSGGNIYVVWQDYSLGDTAEVLYKKSTDGGASWISKRLTWNPENSCNAVVRVDTSGNIHVFWDDSSPGNGEIFHKKSTDGGASWTTKRITWNSGNSGNPDVLIDTGGNIHVAWYDNTPGNSEIYYKKSADGGATWASTKRLSWNSESSAHPRIAVDGSEYIHVVWQDFTPGNAEIFHSVSTDSGMTWAAKRLTWSSEASTYPAIAADISGSIHVFWAEGSVNTEIYSLTSTDGGATWGSAKRLTWNSGASSSPEIAIDSSGHFHVVWHDASGGNFDIYYKQK